MPKLTVYLDEELAARLKEADLSPSGICQRALAEALVAPRVIPLEGGWCRVQSGAVEAMVRFVEMVPGVFAAREVTVAAPVLTNADLRAVDLDALTVWADGSDELAVGFIVGYSPTEHVRRAEPAQRVEWGEG